MPTFLGNSIGRLAPLRFCLLNPSREGLDSGQDGGEDHEGVGDDSEPVAPGAFDEGPPENDGTDTEGLQEHFQLTGPGGAELDTAVFGDVPECLDDDLAGQNNNRGSPLDNVQRQFFKPEAFQQRLTHPGEAEIRTTHEEFVGQRVHGTAEFAGYLKLAGEVAIDNISQAGNNEQDKGPQQQGGTVKLCLAVFGPVRINE